MDDINRLLVEIKSLQGALPPVDRWHPERTVAIDIRIDSNGEWFHEGDPIRRHELVRLFSSILRKDADGYCLVTPAERCLITVDDVPFIAHVDAIVGVGESQEIFLRTNVGDLFRLDASHPLQVRRSGLGDVPYARVRGGLDARLDRAAYYQLMDRVVEEAGQHYLLSAGEKFLIA
ncbi:MAG: DUF1285 domain-containing protein [Gammaproteobacteria bacterium]|nr:MAG: DUF1285 domain-containing protein [Gammaproteobacteria bacterium]